MANIGSLVADLSANSAAFAADMGKAQRALKSGSARMNRSLAGIDRGFAKVGRSVGRTLKGMVGFRALVGTVAGTAGLGLLVKRSLDAADSIAKVADKVGLGTAALQELRFAAEQSGVAQNQLDIAVQRFSRRVGEAAQGQGELKDTLIDYNIQLRDAEGNTRSVEAIMADYADAVAGAESEQEQLRLAFKAFDTEGAALVNLLRKGSAGMAGLRQQARSLGLVIREDLLRGAEDSKDSLSVLAQVIKTRVITAVVTLAPRIQELTESLIEGLPTLIDYAQRFGEFTGLLTPVPDRLRDIRAEIEKINEQQRTRAGPFGRGPSDRQAATARRQRLRDEARELQFELRRGRALSGLPAPGAGATGSAPLAVRDIGAPIPGRKPGGISALAEQFKLSAEAADDFKARAKAVFEETRTPLEDFNTRIGALNELVEGGGISWDTYARAVKQAQDDLSETGRVAEQVTRATGDLAVDAIQGQITSWGDLGTAALKVLSSILVKQLEVNAAASAGIGGGGTAGLVGRGLTFVASLFTGGGGGGFNAERTSSPGGIGGFAEGG